MSSSVIPATTPVSWTAVPDGSAASPSFAFQNSSGTGFYRVSANVLGISTAGVQRVVIDASGNVGVGRATNLTGSANFKAIGIGATGTIMAGATTGGAYMAQNLYFDGAVWRYLINGTALLYEQAGGSHTWFYAASGTGGNSSSNIQAMSIDSSGNLLVGRTTVLGGHSFQNGAETSFYRPSTASAFSICSFWSDVGGAQTVRAYVRVDGGIGNYSANNINLASDQRLKKDIQSLESTWNKVKQIEVVNFRYKDCNEGDPLLYGVIAQQIQPIVPELVVATREATETEPEYYGIREQPMYWLAIKALQEAMSRIEVLEAEIEALKAK